MADFNSTFYTAQTAVSPRGNAPSADAVTQNRESAVLTVTTTTGMTNADFLNLMQVIKPGMQIIPEECRIRPSTTSSDATLQLQYVSSAGTATNLSATAQVTNAVVTLASPAVTTVPPTLATGGYLRFDVTAVGTLAACTYTVELAFRVAGGH